MTSASHRGEDVGSPLEEFDRWYRDNLHQGSRGPFSTEPLEKCRYISEADLNAFFNQHDWLRRAVAFLFPDNSSIWGSYVDTIRGGYIKGFAILLRVGQGAHIGWLIDRKLSDFELPVNLGRFLGYGNNNLTSLPDDMNTYDFCTKWDATQDELLVSSLESEDYKADRLSWIYPFRYVEAIISTDDFVMWEIEVPAAYDQLKRSKNNDEVQNGPAHRYLLRSNYVKDAGFREPHRHPKALTVEKPGTEDQNECAVRVTCIFDTKHACNALVEHSPEAVLLYSALSENYASVETLLINGAHIDARDLHGQTALSIAAKDGKERLAALLLERGAKVDIKDEKGRTALHLAAASSSDEIVRRLLQAGADDSILDCIDRRPRDWATSPEVQWVFDNPPPVLVEPDGTRPRVQLPARALQEPQALATKDFEAVVYYYQWLDWRGRPKSFLDIQSKTMSVHNLIYDNKYTEDFKEGNTELSTSKAFRWIHLPANNIVWMKGLVETLCYKGRMSENHCTTLKRFIDSNLHEHHASNRDACYRQPHVHSQKYHEMHEWTSIVMPYFDSETENSYLKRYGKDETESGTTPPLEVAFPNASELHVAQTLDRFYYSGLETTRKRDLDQVVYRHTANQRKTWQQSHANARDHDRELTAPTISILTVHHLWMWRIDERTVITAFPEAYQCDSEVTRSNTLHAHLVRALSDSRPRDVEEWMGQIVRQSIRYVDTPSKSGLRETLFNIFSSSIAKMSNDVTGRHKDFYKTFDPEYERGDLSLESETRLLREVKDIRDEISMIESVLYHQKKVQKIVGSKLARSDDEMKQELGEDDSADSLAEQTSWIRGDAERVENSLNHLLDLKQAQAGINEALSAKEMNFAVVVFTVVTVIFTPLAFIASLLAIPKFADQFPDDRDNEFNKKAIMIWMVSAEFVTLGAIGISIALLIWRKEIGSALHRPFRKSVPGYASSNAGQPAAPYRTSPTQIRSLPISSSEANLKNHVNDGGEKGARHSVHGRGQTWMRRKGQVRATDIEARPSRVLTT